MAKKSVAAYLDIANLDGRGAKNLSQNRTKASAILLD